MWESVFFWLFGGLAVFLGFLVISLRNPVHCAVALVCNMFSLAALFAVLDAHFLAALQVLVYAGAIMVLILFVIMLLNLKPEELENVPTTPGSLEESLAALRADDRCIKPLTTLSDKADIFLEISVVQLILSNSCICFSHCLSDSI